jgi:hypothetical protein
MNLTDNLIQDLPKSIVRVVDISFGAEYSTANTTRHLGTSQRSDRF